MNITFGDYVLTDLFIVGNVSRPLAVKSIDLIDIPGMDGAYRGLTTLNTADITMDITIPGSPTERVEKLRQLGAILNIDTPTKLAFEDDSGLYYLAVPSGGDITRYVDGAVVDSVTFTCPDPVMYGQEITETSETFTVGGNYPTKPTITITDANNGNGGAVGVRLDDGDYMYVSVSAANSKVVMDCAKRTVMINRTTGLITLTSDWLELTPGEHKLTLDQGTGTVEVAYIERWV